MAQRRLKKNKQRGMNKRSGKLPMSDLDKEKKKKLSEVHRQMTKAALEKQRAAVKKE